MIAARPGDAGTVYVCDVTNARNCSMKTGEGGGEEPNISRFASTVEALLSDHLENSKTWSRLELVANKNEFSSATAW